MQNAGFEQALTSRVDDMLDACTKCGKCFEVCPIAAPAGLGDADPKAVVSGVLDILRFGKGVRGIREVGQGLHGQRRVHQGLRLRRQSALPVDDGAARDDAERQGPDRAAQAGRHRVPQDRRGHQRAVAAAALRGVADPPRPEAVEGSAAHRIARRGVLHRLQRAQDAAHRAVVPRHHGHDRHRLSGDGRADPLLRNRASFAPATSTRSGASPTTPSRS